MKRKEPAVTYCNKCGWRNCQTYQAAVVEWDVCGYGEGDELEWHEVCGRNAVDAAARAVELRDCDCERHALSHVILRDAKGEWSFFSVALEWEPTYSAAARQWEAHAMRIAERFTDQFPDAMRPQSNIRLYLSEKLAVEGE